MILCPNEFPIQMRFWWKNFMAKSTTLIQQTPQKQHPLVGTGKVPLWSLGMETGEWEFGKEKRKQWSMDGWLIRSKSLHFKVPSMLPGDEVWGVYSQCCEVGERRLRFKQCNLWGFVPATGSEVLDSSLKAFLCAWSHINSMNGVALWCSMCNIVQLPRSNNTDSIFLFLLSTVVKCWASHRHLKSAALYTPPPRIKQSKASSSKSKLESKC